MKFASAFVFALSAALTFASPVPSNEAALEKRQGCNYSTPNKSVIDRIYKVAKSRNVNSKVMLAMFMTAAVESNFNNLSCGDKDSVGVFQQRASQGWGSYDQIMNVEYSTNKFLDVCIPEDRAHPSYGLGQLAQAVQRSEIPDAYAKKEGIARQLLNEAISRNGGSSGNGGATNVGTSPGKSNPGSGNSNSGSSSPSSGSCAKTVTVVGGNTCSGIASKNGVSLSTLYSLNKSINSGCTNLQIGQKVCVKKGSGSTSSAKPSTGSSGSGGCSKKVTVAKGNTCSGIASKNGIALSKLYSLNKSINSKCTNLQIGQKLCLN